MSRRSASRRTALRSDPTMFASTAPFRQAFLAHFPERPFSIRFWDGTSIPSTTGGGPTFDIRSPRAFAYALSAPGQLGLGRAYVAGEIVPDEMDATLDVVGTLEAAGDRPQGPGAARVRRRAGVGAAEAAARPGRRAETGRSPAQHRARPARGPPPLRRLQRVLRALPRRVDDVLLRRLGPGRDDARGGPVREARHGLPQARPQAGRLRPRRRLGLGLVRASRRPRVRRAGPRHHALAAAGGARAAAGGGGRALRQDRVPGPRLPRPAGRGVRRGVQHRHGRARRQPQHRRVPGEPATRSSSPAAGC